MKKLFILITCFIPLFSQAQLRIGLSGAYSIPTGDFGSINKNGYGASLTGKYSLSDKWALIGNFSYYAFGKAGDNLGDLAQVFGLSPSTINLLEALGTEIQIPKVSFFPVNIGFEYYFLTNKIKPYIGLDLGYYFTDTEKVELNLSELLISYFQALGQPAPPVSLGSIDLSGSDANFGLAPLIGCVYYVNDRLSLDLNGKANGIYVPDKKSAATVISINLGIFYTIGLYK